MSNLHFVPIASALLLAAALFATGCQATSAQPASEPLNEAAAVAPAGSSERVDGARAREAVEAGAMLIDVRTPQEFAGGHIDGAINIPVDQIGPDTELGEAETIVVYCRSGRRSAAAAQVLASRGLDVLDLGPMSAW